MASILERYGIKEVADVTFYEIGEDGEAGAPVLYLDTLKVSTTEQTAENTSARGGKGNPELIVWDYNKEINVTLEDALFSMKSMAMMYGVEASEIGKKTSIKKTVLVEQLKGDAVNGYTVSTQGGEISVVNPKFYGEAGNEMAAITENNDGVDVKAAYCTFDVNVDGVEIVISADRFPGSYYVTGDTYARSETTGEDEFFQFIIPKAKVLSEVTLTMEAEGDPSTFSMNLKVLRPKTGEMMKLVKYSLPEA